jgi:tRNA-binding EMAP/Myf-like protein
MVVTYRRPPWLTGSDHPRCEKIDVGEDEPRQIVSGLRAWYTKEQMLGKRLIAVCIGINPIVTLE